MTIEATQPRVCQIAPAWHTVLTILLVLGLVLLNVISWRPDLPKIASPSILSDFLSITAELLIAAMVLWGLHLGRTPLRQVIGGDWRKMRRISLDVIIAVFFLIVAGFFLYRLYYFLYYWLHPSINTSWHEVAPHTGAELACWIIMAVLAGFCEELVFRGYLQQQFACWTHSPMLGIFGQSILFGLFHSYQGEMGMMLTGAFGFLFGLLALWRNSLRPGMVAHCFWDSIVAIIFFLQ